MNRGGATGTDPIPAMRPAGSRCCTLIASGLLLFASLLPGCVSVPEQVQLLHNGRPGVACAAEALPPARSAALDGNGFSVTSWNLYKGRLAGWQEDLDALQAQSDVLLLQEAHLIPELVAWLGERELDWTMANAYTLSGDWAGVLTISKVPQVSVCAQRITEPYLRLPKTVLISYLPLRGQPDYLLVVNIHGVNFTLGSGTLARQLRAIEAVIRRHTGPLVLAGDFNTWSDARMAVVRKLAADNGLQPVPLKEPQAAGYFGRQLDHIYFRGLIPRNSRTTRVESSDHFPITVTFSLDGRL